VKGEKLKVDFAVQRGQRLLAGYAEQEQSQSPAGELKVLAKTF